jgi:integrase
VAKTRTRITDLQIKHAVYYPNPDKSAGRSNYLHDDGDNGRMTLEITENGAKNWRVRFTFNGKPGLLSLGTYPKVSIAEARIKRDEVFDQIKNGINPSTAREEKKLEAKTTSNNTFEAIALEWMERHPPGAETTADKNRWLLGFAFDAFGKRPVELIDSADVLELCQAIEDSGRNETARRVKVKCGQVFRYAIATRRLKHDPTTALARALKPVVVKHRAAITDPKAVAVLLRDIDTYKGTMIVRCALQLSPLVFLRPGELRAARWADIDFDTGLWSFTPPKTRNQTGVELIIPLPAQAIAILKSLHQVNGNTPFVFASWGKSGHLSESAVLNGLRRMGYDTGKEMSGHGFRAMARTILEEVLGHRAEVIEQQLAHKIKDANGRAYNRTKNLDERKRMMQEWADYLDGLKAGAEVISLSKSAA